MSKQLRIWLFVLLCTLLTSTSLLAEGVITMTTSKAYGEKIRLRIEANGNVTIEGVKETGQTNEDGQKYYTIENRTITIRGDVTSLYCSSNQLISLDVSDCTALTSLNCWGNDLISLDVSDCTALTTLDCRWNSLTSLDVSGCTALTTLDCRGNQLISLDVSGCTSLTALDCSNKKLTSLNVSGCIALTKFDCSSNQLINLDVSDCIFLQSLSCEGNQLTSLDVSKNTALTSLSCGGNQLTSLDVSTNTALTELKCWRNKLTNLDISGCTDLKELSCGGNQLASLDVSKNTALTELYCGGNQLTSLDVSQNTALTGLGCGGNQLTSLNVSGCTALTGLSCEDNVLTSLDISGCTSLRQLNCSSNQLTSLDVSGCPSLSWVDCHDNQLTSLDVSNCRYSLNGLDCSSNQLTSLDVSNCFSLRSLDCFKNQLASLNLSDCRSLETLKSYGNKFNSKAIHQLITSLPNRKGIGLGKFYVIDSDNNNTCYQYDVDLAKKKFWLLYYEAGALYLGEPNPTFALTYEPTTSGGSIIIKGADDLQHVAYGTELTIEATPATGHILTSLTANEEDILSTKSFVMMGDTEVKATFSKARCRVTLTKSGEGTIATRGASDLNSVTYGTELTIVATPATGYELVSITANGTDITASKKIVVKENLTVKVTFAKKTFIVSLDKSGEGTVTATGVEDLNAVPYGTELTISAQPKMGYELTALTANNKDILKTRKAVITEKTTIRATFTKKTFAVTLGKEGEGVLNATGADDLKAVPYGTKLTVSATPAEGYELTGLLANGLDILQSKSTVVTEETSIKAIFRKKTFAVKLTNNEHGVISIAEPVDPQRIPYGTELTIEATPKQGYELTALTANGENILSTQRFVVKGDTEVKATFTKKTFAVTLDKEGEGKVDATGAEDLTAVPYGTELTIKAMPKQGYELTALTANGKDILATKKVVVTENLTIKATFAQETFVVTLDKEGEGVLDATGADNLKAVPYGTKLTIIATPAEGYELKALLAGGFDIRSTKSVEVTGDTRIKAIFTQQTFAVTLTSNEHGDITIVEPVDLQAVPYGTTLTVKATGKNAQCELTALTANGKDILATKSFVVKGATEVKATFVDHTGVETTVTQQVKLYPNPATDYVIVEGVAPASEVTLHSMTGERLYAGRVDDRGVLQIDLTPYADGVYLVCVAGETYRVVVRH